MDDEAPTEPGRIEPGRHLGDGEQTWMEVYVSDDDPAVAVVRAGAMALQIERAGERVSGCLYRIPTEGGRLTDEGGSNRCDRLERPELTGQWPSISIAVTSARGRVDVDQAVDSVTLHFETQAAAWQALADLGHTLRGKCSFPHRHTDFDGREDPASVSVRCTLGILLKTGPRRLEIVRERGLHHRAPTCSDFGDATEFEIASYSDAGGLCFRDFVVDRHSSAAEIREFFDGKCTGDEHDLTCAGIRFAPGADASREDPTPR